MTGEIGSLTGGLVLLFLGGEALVRGSVAIAERLQISKLIIGMVIVGFGTSAPELLVSVQAALAGSPDIAIGNIIGSNIANVLLRVVGHLPCHGISTGHGLAGVGQGSGEETAGVQAERFGRFGLWGFDVCTVVWGRVWQGWMALMR